jgi:3,4-dihydroxy 2-butanone 4-phosphate synthase/GTP cyclohydrolase II
MIDQPFTSVYGGDFRLFLYRNLLDGSEHIALTRGRIDPDKPTLVRMHQVDFFADALGHDEGRRTYIAASLKALANHDGPGVAVFLRDGGTLAERLGHGHGDDLGLRSLRQYGVGAQILLDLGVRDMILMSLTAKPAGLEGYGLKIVGRVPVPTLTAES